MPSRVTAGAVAVSLVVAGCITTTAHRLALTDNPLREQAVACEAHCRAADPGPDPDRYAACLDACPGARAADGSSCSHPDPGAICVETTKAHGGAIVGWIFVGFGTVLAAAAAAVLSQLFTALSGL